MPKASLNRRYQITLPPEVCERLGIRPGDTLDIRVEGGQILLQPLRPPLEEVLQGLEEEDPEALAQLRLAVEGDAIHYVRSLRASDEP